MKKKEDISKTDKKYWEEYLKNPRDVFDKDNNSERPSIKNLRFKFESEGFDSIGNSYDLNELLDTEVSVTPRMGSNPESIELTKLIAPLQSHGFVLATPDNYEAFLSQYGMFSYLDAYSTTDDGYLDDDNVIYLFMLPDVKRKLVQKNKQKKLIKIFLICPTCSIYSLKHFIIRVTSPISS